MAICQRRSSAIAFASIMAICIGSAAAQTSADIDRAARNIDRIQQAYAERKYQQHLEQLDHDIAEARITDGICKPMHEQKGLSRRQYISSLLKKKGDQRYVIRLCAEQELILSYVCRSFDVDNGIKYPVARNGSCPNSDGKWPEVDPLDEGARQRALAVIMTRYQE